MISGLSLDVMPFSRQRSILALRAGITSRVRIALCGGTAYDFVGIALIDIVDRPNNYVHVGLTDRARTVLKEWRTAMSSNLEFDLLSWFPFDQEIGRWNHE